jgi:capsular exopolysaccharide synthesis family protein
MSEIFDFLKKTTEADRNKRHPDPAPVMELPAQTELPAEQAAVTPIVEDIFPEEIADNGDSKFDLAESTYQIRNILNPHTVVGEQFRLLRTRLDLMQKQSGIKTMLVTSTLPQEGKTFTSCGMAGVFAHEEGKRVVVIDADMRKPGTGRDFGFNGNSNLAGMSQVLRGEMEFHNALLGCVDPEFFFLPAGPIPSNPSELLSLPSLEQALRTAAENFDWVIIDSPPVLSLSDATLLALLCDVVLLVVRANSTPYKLIIDAVQRIGKQKICGVVINRQKQLQSSRYYHQYYHHSSKRRKE